VKLPAEPKSVPDYTPGAQPTAREQELAKWLTLGCDPFLELRQIVLQEGAWEPVGAERKAPCANMPAVIGGISTEGDLLKLLERHGLKDAFHATVGELAGSGTLQELDVLPRAL
jgi:hypothetical protein